MTPAQHASLAAGRWQTFSLLLREALLDFFLGENGYRSSDKSWRDYFYAFAYAAARQREAGKPAS